MVALLFVLLQTYEDNVSISSLFFLSLSLSLSLDVKKTNWSLDWDHRTQFLSRRSPWWDPIEWYLDHELYKKGTGD